MLSVVVFFQIILYGNQEDSDYYLNELKTIQLPDYFMLQKTLS